MEFIYSSEQLVQQMGLFLMVIIILKYKEMSFKDIADLENISINTALGRMRYALINLRKLIEKHQLVTDF